MGKIQIAMADYTIGSINKRELRLRWIVPWVFKVWDSHYRDATWFRGSFLFAPGRMWHPIRWWKAITQKASWSFACNRIVGATHRCYCATGSLIDGRIILFGFGVVWFYSHFTGEIPCSCDEARGEILE